MTSLQEIVRWLKGNGRNVLPAPRAGAWLLAAALILMATFPSIRAQPHLTEHQMQAAVLGNLAKFVEWPKGHSANGPIVIGIVGHDPFGADLETILKEVKVQGRSFQVKRSSSVAELLTCQILYFSARDSERIRDVRNAIQQQPILTVGEDPRFLDLGGMVNFQLEDKKVRFAINLASAEQAGLSLHTQLLRLATEVKKK